MTHLPDDEAVLLAAAKAASTTPRPTSAQTARRARALERALAQHAERQRRALPRRTVAAAVLLVAGAASATTALLLGGIDDDEPAAAFADADDAAHVRGPRLALPTTRARSLDGTAWLAESVAESVAAPVASLREAPAPSPTETTQHPRTSVDAPAHGGAVFPTTNTPPTSDHRARAGTARAGAARADTARAGAARATTTAASAALTTTNDVEGHDGFERRAVAIAIEDIDVAERAPTAFDDERDATAAARVLRDRCIDGLRARRDRAAIDDCRVFGQRFPGHPAARALAFGAGGLAEELGLPHDAIDAYSRAILLSPLVGATWDDALLARARVYADVGELEQARADLRIYLHRSPEAASDAGVLQLRRALQLER